jgi:hypothetical protein
VVGGGRPRHCCWRLPDVGGARLAPHSGAPDGRGGYAGLPLRLSGRDPSRSGRLSCHQRGDRPARTPVATPARGRATDRGAAPGLATADHFSVCRGACPRPGRERQLRRRPRARAPVCPPVLSSQRRRHRSCKQGNGLRVPASWGWAWWVVKDKAQRRFLAKTSGEAPSATAFRFIDFCARSRRSCLGGAQCSHSWETSLIHQMTAG